MIKKKKKKKKKKQSRERKNKNDWSRSTACALLGSFSVYTYSSRERTFDHVRPAKIPISLRIRAVRSESSLGIFWIAKDAKILHADNEDSY